MMKLRENPAFRVTHRFRGCNHVILRKQTEPEPSDCPYCRNERRKADRGEA